MTRARLAKLEAQAQQQRAALEAVNTDRVQEALSRMSWADLGRMSAAVKTGKPWACPWEDVPPGLPEGDAWMWAATIHGLTRAQVWPLPPAGAALVFEREAAKAERSDPARLAWLVMARLAQVIGVEV
ncbi:hypothetical protein [Deinococcus altitudinis]|uniref:hypothetical protein n=1 Tax=Deinococcus altitudinis TaxID=468914 RepID=UPI0038928939